MARPKPARRRRTAESAEDGFWDRPALMNLVADILIVFGIAAMAWAIATSIQRLPIFPLREVVVARAVDNVTRIQIEQAIRAALVGNYFTVDLDQVRNVFEKLPWVRQVEVRRRWPDTLVLQIEEHVAVARWQQADNEARLVNNFGEVFAAASDRELPIFSGPEGTAAPIMTRYLEFSQVLNAVERTPAVLALSTREAWQVTLDDGLVIELGRDEAKHTLSERMARFVAWYGPALDKTRLARAKVVDMRYPNGFALRLQQSDMES
ncbi:MAG: cell division protein FtsQ/DivIB [Gammaproteobacteria bacterium]|nr:cell division protein FtsQ/DivIB [Gammaproteobacteria bacterium]MBU1415673.1 cell division protein FtsQ/DivIB [Gammaproteobacteria bacterium]